MDEDDPGDLGPTTGMSALTLLLIVAFELSLGALALAVGWLLGVDPLRSLPATHSIGPWLTGTGIGVAAAAPLALGMLLLDHSRNPSLVELRHVVEHDILPIFRGASTASLALISLAAGLGEEILCRGLIQSGLADWWRSTWGDFTAWLATAILFGLAHFITRTYAVLSIVVGLYLGALFWWTGNVWVPIVTHAVYDFAALLYLLNTRQIRR